MSGGVECPFCGRKTITDDNRALAIAYCIAQDAWFADPDSPISDHPDSKTPNEVIEIGNKAMRISSDWTDAAELLKSGWEPHQ